MERLHQSIAKVLLTACPAVARHQLDNPEEKKPSKAMDIGSLVDALVFGGASYHTISADDYRKKATQEERDAARERGQIPILEKEIESAKRLAGAIRAKLLGLGVNLDTCMKQHALSWQSPPQWAGDTGVACAGKPDLADLQPRDWLTIDLKVGGIIAPDYLDRHVVDQGWDIQAAAYQEAGHVLYPHTEHRGGHFLLAAETSGAMMIELYPFDESMMELGRRRWQRAQRIWQKCQATNEWPGYPVRGLRPTNWQLEQEMERRD